MVQKASASSKRGRPRAFDADRVIDAAIGAFFVGGYDGTTLADLEAATGVDRSTLYNSFDGKAGLYRHATDRYLADAAEHLFRPLREGTGGAGDGADGGAGDGRDGGAGDGRDGGAGDGGDGGEHGLDDIIEFLGALRSGLTGSEISPGCLIVNDMAAGSNVEAARRYRDMLEGGLRAALARTDRPIPAEVIEHRVGLLASAVIGINLISRHTGDNEQVERLVDGAVAQVEAWREHDRT